jgi:alpha-L-fucosidase
LPGGDYDTPEQFVPAQPPERPWEVCLTMNESWGYNPPDTRYKSARSIVHTISEIAGKGGRLLLNIGPDGDGRVPPEQAERLEAVAEWMSRNGEAITGTAPGLVPWQFYGPSTRKGGTTYVHLLMRPYETVSVRGVPIRRVKSVRALADGRELKFTTRCAILDQLLNSDPLGELTIEVAEDALDPLATVLAVEIQPAG